MTKIHHLVFALRLSQDERLDKIIEFKIQKNGWIKERHLDLPFIITDDLLAIFKIELFKLNSFRAPKDKLTIIHNALLILASTLFFKFEYYLIYFTLIYTHHTIQRLYRSTHRYNCWKRLFTSITYINATQMQCATTHVERKIHQKI